MFYFLSLYDTELTYSCFIQCIFFLYALIGIIFIFYFILNQIDKNRFYLSKTILRFVDDQMREIYLFHCYTKNLFLVR